MNINTKKILNNGYPMPIFGLGVYKSAEHTYESVRTALDAGYIHIDTASMYNNESDVGKAVIDSGIGRKNVFITTKVWNDDLRNDTVTEAFYKSLELLKTDYVDLYLIHWAVKGKFVDAYLKMEELYNKGLIKALGVSNFLKHHLDELIPKCHIVPAVNQMEIHPYLTNDEEIAYCNAMGIAAEAWSPMGRGRVLNDELLAKLGQKYGKSVAQIIIRWHLQRGLIVIPKSVNKDRIIENSLVFDFSIEESDMRLISDLNCNLRTGSHPDHFTF